MAVRESAVHKNHTHTLCIYKVSPFFHNGCMSGPYILESTKGIDMELGTYIDVDKRKCRRQEP